MLRENQKQLNFNTIYKITKIQQSESDETIDRYIFSNDFINVYTYCGATDPSTLEEMTLESKDTGIFGTVPVISYPNYILCTNQGNATSVILSGFEVEEVTTI